ncbi:cytochrome P450 [Gloeophyllum trabeum ATCC 11539]|uniref:Cytochrome P450 n=1 Tax=Gloeophyllum trabeum (strain ATCC 11539 / FP-39264 / Madison 617) TaxID=670483 RepID=S7RYR5_GLOTA|nr:cytochrome P450 [Gloeophyllum trabeum ATCC 11539]EPQ60090.1 cytochrome P450 [Gloeophyllum trabeum ATCC 11539]
MGAPPIGYPHWLGPYYGGFRFFFHARKMTAEGYRKVKSQGVFKLPRWNSWLYVVAGDTLVKEIHSLPDDTLSLLESAYEELQMKYTMGENLHFDPYHVPVLKVKLRRNLEHMVSETTEEVLLAFEEQIGRHCDDEWKEMDVVEPLVKVMSRTFNRIIVGPSLCRNENYIEIASRSALERFIIGFFINTFPSFLRPLVGRLVTRLPKTVAASMKHYLPMILDRKAAISEYGKDWSNKPNDVLSWLMDIAKGTQSDPHDLTIRLLAVNGASTHTSSLSFTQAIINMAVHADYAGPLREEAHCIIDSFGWSKAALDRLVKMDSFLKESMRVNGLGSVTHARRAVKPIRLSDGTYVPEGSYISAALDVHFDERHYPNPEIFNGWRFYDDSNSLANGEDGFVVPKLHYLPWGYGKHAWYPGRFIVAYVMKALMAHIVLNYDLKMGGNGGRPRDVWFGYMCSHSRSVK